MNESDRKTVVVFQTPWLTHVVENLVFLVLQNPGTHVVILTGENIDAPPQAEHPSAYARLKEKKGVELLPPQAPARPSDYMIIRLNNRGFLWDKNLNDWVAKSNRVGFLSDAYYFGQSLKSRIAELVYNFPYWLKADFGIFQTGSSVNIPFINLGTKVFHIPYVHPQHLINTRCSALLFQTQEAKAFRKFRMVFIGNENPEARRHILRSVENTASRLPGIVIHKSVPDRPLDPDKKHVLWIEYGDHDGERGLVPEAYLKILRQAEFCLCPQGWDLWSHRVSECLLCGAVPILEHEQLYDLPLQDEVNCLLAGTRGWAKAAKKALEANKAECHAMGVEASLLASTHLNISSMAAPLHCLFCSTERK